MDKELYALAEQLGRALLARGWMLAAAECRLRFAGGPVTGCAKLHHENPTRCIFRCGYPRPTTDRP